MNKIKITAIVACLSLIASAVTAETRIGISGHFLQFSSDGSETLRTSGNVTNKSVEEDVVVPSIFAEVVGEKGIGFGVDYVPVAELGSQTSSNKVDAETNGENKASAELLSHITLYTIAEHPTNGLYGKLGIAFADVDTTDALSTGSVYGNSDTTGIMLAVGKTFKKDNGIFVRGEASYTDYDDVSITSSGGNTVKADIDSMGLSLSIGKSF
tara:strand:+ start:709 stop:1344 length:636 start_codon:yes stop_codon:yes gene_type:complete